MSSIRRVSWLLVAFAVGVPGCSTQSSALRADNAKLHQSLDDLREDRRDQERKMRDLQHQLDESRAAQVSTVAASVPQLPVEVVAPQPQAGGDRVVGVADDGGEIVYEGDAAAGRFAQAPAAPAAASAPVVDQPPPSPSPTARAQARAVAIADAADASPHRPSSAVAARRAHLHANIDRDPPGDRGAPAAATATAATAAAADPGNEYRAAVDLLRGGHPDDAITALRAFIAHYPHHDYADNAQYWLGEAYYAQKDYNRALVEFRATIENYPRGNKVPDALLKVGYCYQALGQADKSRAVLEQVVSLYPKTEPAALASKRLEIP